MPGQVYFRLHCPRCGLSNIVTIALPKEKNVIDVLCADCNYVLGEFGRKSD